MTTYFVSRHSGAVEWVKRQGREVTIVSHLEPTSIKRGDVVLGTLPVHVVAQLNERGARFFHLEMNTNANQRGTDLTADDMERLDAKLVEYEARRVSGDEEYLASGVYGND